MKLLTFKNIPMKSIVLFLMICISIIPLNIVGQTPIDATHPFARVICTSTPQTNPYGAVWFQSVTLQNNHFPNNGYILVDTIKLIEEDIATGNETVRYIENYNGSGALTLNEGGLYERFPKWNFKKPFTFMSNSNRSGGFLTIKIGEQPDSINHFWGVRQLCTIGKRHKVEISVLISGDIALQAGMDYYTNLKDTSDCKEAFYSKWYGDSNGQYITIKFPGYGKFDRSDYGFYTNGKFYLSKKLVDFVGGSSVALLRDATNWQPALMTLNGDFYEYDTKSSIAVDMSYCFRINPDGNNNSSYVPHLVINNLVYPNDAVDNGQEGYNFHTSPQTAVNISEITSENKICIYPNPSSDYIYIKSSSNINNIQVYDCKGNGIVTKCEPDISSINITNLPNGMYFLKLETKNGIVFRKFIKE